MKNLIGFIALITVLSGCGRSVENWTCEIGQLEPIITETVTIDFENNTWKFLEGRVAPFKEIESKVFSNFKNQGGYDITIMLDRDTGEYTSGNQGSLLKMGICSKQ